MLILRRKPGQSVDITHGSGHTIKIHVHEVSRSSREVQIGFDDPARNFEILRSEKVAALGVEALPTR